MKKLLSFTALALLLPTLLYAQTTTVRADRGALGQLKVSDGSPATVAQLANGILISGTTPAIDIYESDQGTDLKRWRLLASGAALFFQYLDDAYTTATSTISLDRSGNVGIMTGLALGAAAPSNTADLYLQANGVAISETVIAQGVPTGVTNFFNIPTTVAGPHFGSVFQIKGAPSGTSSYKVALYSAAETGGGSDDVYGANFVVQRNSGATASNVIGAEININNNNASVALNATPLVVGLNITSGGGFQPRSAIYIAASNSSDKFRKGIEIIPSSVSDTGLEVGGPTSGMIGTIIGKLLVNNGDGFIMQRFTDSSPTGYLLRGVNAANSVNLFLIDVAGMATFTSEHIGIATLGTVQGTNSLMISGTTPTLDLYETDQGADLKRWRMIGSGAALFWQSLDDAYSSATSQMSLDRAGTLTVTAGIVGAGLTISGNSAVNGAVTLGGVISPAALAADQNNYNPTGLSTASVIRLSATTSTRTITGITAQAAGTWLLLINGGVIDIALANNSGSSTAGSRFQNPGSATFTLNSGDSVWIWYDGASTVWRTIAY